MPIIHIDVVGKVGIEANGAQFIAPAIPMDPSAPPPTPVAPRIRPDGVPLSLEGRAAFGDLLIVAGIIGTPAIGGARGWSDLDHRQAGEIEQHASNRELYAGAGAVFAAGSLTPRVTFTAGTVNVPHVVDFMLHAGVSRAWTLPAFRVDPLLDAEIFGGVIVPGSTSLLAGPTANFAASLGFGVRFH